MRKKKGKSRVLDEYEQYCATAADECITDPLQWWLGNRTTYPILSGLALTLLAIPAQSAECERVFSSMNQLVTEDRHSLTPENIESEVLLFKWLKELPGLIDVDRIDCTLQNWTVDGQG